MLTLRQKLINYIESHAEDSGMPLPNFLVLNLTRDLAILGHRQGCWPAPEMITTLNTALHAPLNGVFSANQLLSIHGVCVQLTLILKPITDTRPLIDKKTALAVSNWAIRLSLEMFPSGDKLEQTELPVDCLFDAHVLLYAVSRKLNERFTR